VPINTGASGHAKTYRVLDGVFESPQTWGAMTYGDEAHWRDGLGVLLACYAMLMGKKDTYEASAKIWPSRTDAWAIRLNAMQKYVFSSTLETADWGNSTIVREAILGRLKRFTACLETDIRITKKCPLPSRPNV